MKRQSWSILMVGLVLIGGTAGLIQKMQASQRLGRPGVRVVNEPLYGRLDTGDTNALFLVASNQVDLPETALDYRSRPVPVDKIVLDWLPKDTTYGQRDYQTTNGFTVKVMVVLMGIDRTSIHQPQYCLTGGGWNITASEITGVPMEKPHRYDLPVMKLTTRRYVKLEDGRQQLLHGVYAYWFVADGELTADHRERMWWMARDMMRSGVLQRWAYVTYFAVCLPGQEEATFERMKKLMAATVPQFQLVAGTPLPALAGGLPTTGPQPGR